MPHDHLLRAQANMVVPGVHSPGSIARTIRCGERVFLSGATATQGDGSVVGLGEARTQTGAALDSIEGALAAVGGSLRDITKLTISLIDRAHGMAVYETIGRRLRDVFPVGAGHVVAGLARPELMVQIDAEAVIGTDVQRLREFDREDWLGQGIAWRGAMIATTESEIFVCGLVASALDDSFMTGLGRRPEDAAAQADFALANLGTLLREAGSDLDDVCKITVYIADRAYRPAVYPVIGRHLRGIHPVSTGLIVSGFAQPEILFAIDAQAHRKRGGAHARVRRYHSNMVRYGFSQQNIDCDFCMAVNAGGHVLLRGQTGTDLNEVMHGAGDAEAQAEQAMTNVRQLLHEAGAGLGDVTKATVFVTDRAYLAGVTDVVLRHLGPAAPCLSTLIVKGLASPELFMEVDITAMIREGIA